MGSPERKKAPAGTGAERQKVSPDQRQAYIDAEVVRNAAAGRWHSIFPALGIPAEYLRPRHGACPGCGGKDRFRQDDPERGGFICGRGGGDPLAGDGFTLLQHVHGWTFPEAVAAVAAELGMDGQSPAPRPQPAPKPKPQPTNRESRRKRKALRRASRESHPIHHAADAWPVALYLRHRGLAPALNDLPHDLRFHPGLGYWEPGDKGPRHVGDFPALLAVVRAPDGRPVTLHRTYLTHRGEKAPVESPRKLMPAPADGATKGGAIRLFPAGPTLAVAEGIETALAVRLATGWPVWATISANGMQALAVPEWVTELVACADFDQAGLDAAEALARGFTDRGGRARVAIPPRPGMDWADAIQEGAE
jgi:putative DNA primase/helicase